MDGIMTKSLLGSVLDHGRPPLEMNPDDNTRRIGVEIELGGLDLDCVAKIVTEVFGGDCQADEPNRRLVKATDLGDIIIELDSAMLHPEHPKGVGTRVKDLLDDEQDLKGLSLKDSAFALMGDISKALVPVEIVTEPVPFHEIESLDDLVAALRDAGGYGTEDSFFTGFGLHLNPEAASLDSGYILSILRAYCLLEDLLWAEIDVDPTRKLMPFISPYPKDYARHILAPDYCPDLATLMDDYMKFNPTRNKALDLLPLFAEIDPKRVASQVDDKLVKARPAFHYRLPDCRLGEKNWSVTDEWHRWVCVETLADDPDTLADWSKAYLKKSPSRRMADWVERLEDLLT